MFEDTTLADVLPQLGIKSITNTLFFGSRAPDKINALYEVFCKPAGNNNHGRSGNSAVAAGVARATAVPSKPSSSDTMAHSAVAVGGVRATAVPSKPLSPDEMARNIQIQKRRLLTSGTPFVRDMGFGNKTIVAGRSALSSSKEGDSGVRFVGFCNKSDGSPALGIMNHGDVFNRVSIGTFKLVECVQGKFATKVYDGYYKDWDGEARAYVYKQFVRGEEVGRVTEEEFKALQQKLSKK